MIRCSIFFAAAHIALPAGVTPKSAPSFGETEAKQRAEQAKTDYRNGLQFANGGAGNWTEAARLYRKAAEAGYAPAQYDLAHLYVDGLGVPRDLKEAAVWYRKAAEQGDAEAQNNLGALYAKGLGVRRSNSQAIRWYRLAAAQNDPEATSNLGIIYLKGRGVKRDFTQAFQLFLRSAQMGYPAAQNNVALMYANGQGVARDFVWAYAWLQLASEQAAGSEPLRDAVGKRMTPVEIERAGMLASEKAREIAENRKRAH